MHHCGGLGIAAGILGAFMLFRIVRMLVWRRHMGGGFGRFGGHHHRGFGRRGGIGGSFWLRHVFAKLDTTPGQEREIRSAIEDFQRDAWSAKDGLKGARAHLAKAVTSAEFDESAVVEANATAEDATSKVKDAMAGALRRIHGVLDQKQRERLGDLLANGPAGFRRGWGGPYRA